MLFRSELIGEALRSLPAPVKQDSALATYAAKLTKEEAHIGWRDDAATVARKIRAYNPFPGAATTLAGERVKLWRARAASDQASAAPGTVCACGPGTLHVACGSGVVEILELQRAGGKSLPAAAFLAGHPLTPGAKFGS